MIYITPKTKLKENCVKLQLVCGAREHYIPFPLAAICRRPYAGGLACVCESL